MASEYPEPVLRYCTPDDQAGIAALERKCGFPETPSSFWDQLWANPVLTPGNLPYSPGWVLDAGGAIVGHWGCIPMPVAFGTEDLMAAAGKGLYVDPDWRGKRLGQRLNNAFMTQENIDILLFCTTNAQAGRLFRKMGIVDVPQRDYDIALYWVLRPAGFLAAALQKKGVPGAASSLGGALLSPLFYIEGTLRGRRPSFRGVPADVKVLEIDDIGPEFDDLWHRKRNEGRRLLGYRSSAFLRWHFGKESNKSITRILCCRRNDRLAGYLTVERHHIARVGLVRARIVDIFVERDDPGIVDRLLAAAYSWARGESCHVLELTGFPRSVRERVLAGRPYRRHLPCWPYLYYPMREELGRELENEEQWYACPYDGDASLRGGAPTDQD